MALNLKELEVKIDKALNSMTKEDFEKWLLMDKRREKHNTMKTPQELFRMLNISNYTQRHIEIVKNFIKSDEQDVTKLLNQLGVWDMRDWSITNDWMKLN